MPKKSTDPPSESPTSLADGLSVEEMVALQLELSKKIGKVKKEKTTTAKGAARAEMNVAKKERTIAKKEFDKKDRAYVKTLKRWTALEHGKPAGFVWCDRCERFSINGKVQRAKCPLCVR